MIGYKKGKVKVDYNNGWGNYLFGTERDQLVPGLLSKIVTTVIVPKVSKVPKMFQLINLIISTQFSCLLIVFVVCCPYQWYPEWYVEYIFCMQTIPKLWRPYHW